MTTNSGTVQFDLASLQTLASLVGAPWRLVTGRPLLERPGSLSASRDVVLAVEGHDVTLHSELVLLGFEGRGAQYAHLTVLVGSEGLDDARQRGEVCFDHADEELVGIQVVRETITSMRSGQPEWVYATDIGVVLDLTGGAIGIVKDGHHDQAMLVRISDSLDALDLPHHSDAWNRDDGLGREYRSTRELIPLQTLLGG